jgi:hypothetical protein
MKMHSGTLERSGDRLKLKGSFTDNLRRPANVKITVERGSHVSPDDVVMEGEVRDVSGTLYALAELAWKDGWRPRGLIGTVARVVETYKEPPVDT